MEEKKLGREDILRLMNGLDFLGKEYWITAGAGLVLHLSLIHISVRLFSGPLDLPDGCGG